MAEIKNDIHLEHDELRDTHSLTHFYYQAPFGFDHGNYHTEFMLMLGFLLCKHISTQAAGDSLWGLINPELSETIPRDRVREYLINMTKYAIDV